VREFFASYGDKFQAVLVNDIAMDDISEHLKGVDAVMHVAAPLPSKGDPKTIVNVRVSHLVLNNVLNKLFFRAPWTDL
jgi:hypothetical protein